MNDLQEEEFINLKQIIKNLDTLRNQSILITGASGLIGSYLTDFLIYLNDKENYNIKITAVSRSKLMKISII